MRLIYSYKIKIIMKIKYMSISNYRSIKNINIKIADILQLVGKNNAGKSNILKAIDTFFDKNPSFILQDFKNKTKYIEIEMIGVFNKLNSNEKKIFKAYIIDENINIKLNCKFDQNYDKIIMSRSILMKIPKNDYLVNENINKENIEKWFNDNLIDEDFKKHVNRKTTIQNWKKIVVDYKINNLEKISYINKYMLFNTEVTKLFNNNIPKCIFVPAVRNVMDETKVLQSNPFGKIINHIISILSKKDKKMLMKKMNDFQNIFDGNNKLSVLNYLEEKLNAEFSKLTDSSSDLNISVHVPTYEDIIKNVKINVIEDGQNDEILHKGHGFQRYIIFSLLKTYAEYIKNNQNGSIIFLIEEPELYLHPQAQYKFLSILTKIGSNNDQVIYATHSNILIDLSNLEKMCVVSKKMCVTSKNISTEINQTTNQIIKDKLKIAYANTDHSINLDTELSPFCQPTATFGFFANMIILVEGYTEEISFQTYLNSNKQLNNSGIIIINTHGVTHMPIYQIVYSAFGIPCFVMFDDDKDKTGRSHIAQDALYKLLEYKKDTSYPIIKKNMCIFENDYSDQIKKECKTFANIIKDMPKPDRANKPYIAKIIAQKTINGEIFMLNSIKRIIEILSPKL